MLLFRSALLVTAVSTLLARSCTEQDEKKAEPAAPLIVDAGIRVDAGEQALVAVDAGLADAGTMAEPDAGTPSESDAGPIDAGPAKKAKAKKK